MSAGLNQLRIAPLVCQLPNAAIVRKVMHPFMIKKLVLAALAACWAMTQGFPADFRITSFDRLGHVSWANAPISGIVTVETAADPAGPWQPQCNYFSTNASGQASLPPPTNQTFYRLLAVDITADQNGFDNLVYSYGIIETIAGKGDFPADGLNNWLPEYEGGPATNANLSRPHFSVADRAGNIYIADKDSHAILKVSPDGNIHTAAGTHVEGDNGDGPALATSLQLNHPNGEYLKDDGTLYIMDTNNGKIRRVETNGMMSTLIIADTNLYSLGRGLWVSDDETLAYMAANTSLLKWTPDNGVEEVSRGWGELGTLLVDAAGNVLLTDRLADSVWLMTPDGSATKFAGNGSASPIIDGTPALEVGLYCVRGIWPFPTGGYLYALECGSQIAYQDADGYVYVLVDGTQGNIHQGDGQWFYAGPKVSNCRSVTMDYRGNILITENDAGYVRRVRFQRLLP